MTYQVTPMSFLTFSQSCSHQVSFSPTCINLQLQEGTRCNCLPPLSSPPISVFVLASSCLPPWLGHDGVFITMVGTTISSASADFKDRESIKGFLTGWVAQQTDSHRYESTAPTSKTSSRMLHRPPSCNTDTEYLKNSQNTVHSGKKE